MVFSLEMSIDEAGGQLMQEEEAMQIALEEARLAATRGEVPVGAVLLYQGRLLAKAGNRVEELQQARAHAELLCLEEAAEKLGRWRLCGAVLYCTLEPCAMCWGAINLYRIGTLVYGASDPKHGFWSAFDVAEENYPNHKLEVSKGLFQEQSIALLRSFFQMRRKQNAKKREKKELLKEKE